MPADTDRTHLTSGAASRDDSGSSHPSDTVRGPVWPVTALVVLLGLSMLARSGDPSDPGHERPVRWDDAFQDLTRLNWLCTAAPLVLLALVLWRRRRRQTGMRANP